MSSMSADVTTESGEGVFSEDRFKYDPVTTTSSIVSSATAYDALPKASTLAAQTRLLLRSNFLLRSRIILLPYLFDTPLQELVRCPQQTRARRQPKVNMRENKRKACYKNYHPAYAVSFFRNQSDIDRAVAV